MDGLNHSVIMGKCPSCLIHEEKVARLEAEKTALTTKLLAWAANLGLWFDDPKLMELADKMRDAALSDGGEGYELTEADRQGIAAGVKAMKEGRVTPWEDVKKELFPQPQSRSEERRYKAQGWLPPEVRARPQVVCLCGSTRFMDAFFEAGWQKTLDGEIVLSVGVSAALPWNHGQKEQFLGEDVAAALDELHKRKIDLADYVFVLNVGGYIGDSTRSEVEYAESLGKRVDYLEPRAALDALKGE